jgi:hypothetical protein
MNKHMALSKVGLIVLTAVSLFVCPLLTGGYGLGYGVPRLAEARQIEFTPHVATLEAEATSPTVLGPHAWTIGELFSCPRGHPERCRPDLATSQGNEYFGYGEIAGSPGLYLVWVSDSSSTRHLVVQSTDPQLQGDTRTDDFSDLLIRRDQEIQTRDGALGRTEITGITTGVALSLLAFCPVTWGTACVAAGITLGVGALVTVGVSENERANADSRVQDLETNLIGRFEQLANSARSSGSE